MKEMFMLGLLIGLFLGAVFGVVIYAMIRAARKEDRRKKEDRGKRYYWVVLDDEKDWKGELDNEGGGTNEEAIHI